MNRQPDVLVVGSGLAGMMAAATVVNRGGRVRIVTSGAGALTISSGSIDVLGQANGHALQTPWDDLASLPAEHPYTLVGEQGIREALALFCQILEKQHWPYAAADSGHNILLPTIVGTLKPTWLVPAHVDLAALAAARRVLVLGVQGLREASPALVIDGLRKMPGWTEREYTGAVMPSPLAGVHRSPNTLDLARFVDRPEGQAWLAGELATHAGQADLVLLPPICGSGPNQSLFAELNRAAQAPLVELVSIPPGVGGLRLWQALRNFLDQSDVEWLENAKVVRATMEGNRCTGLVAKAAGGEFPLAARTFVLATGGILGGGIELAPGKVRETVCDVAIEAPAAVSDWSAEAMFDSHLFARFGVGVDNTMRSTAKPLDNVFFAGRTIGGYDHASEKCGHGVALATGWRAGCVATETALAYREGRS